MTVSPGAEQVSAEPDSGPILDLRLSINGTQRKSCYQKQYNTFDKRRLLVNPHPNFVRETKLLPKLFIRDKEMLKFYISA